MTHPLPPVLRQFICRHGTREEHLPGESLFPTTQVTDFLYVERGLTGRIAWGDDRLMRWFCNNTRLTPFQNSNYKYEKKEARGRKTDGFMALVAAFCAVGSLPDDAAEYELPEAFTW